jgi:hypothetical protein
MHLKSNKISVRFVTFKNLIVPISDVHFTKTTLTFLVVYHFPYFRSRSTSTTLTASPSIVKFATTLRPRSSSKIVSQLAVRPALTTQLRDARTSLRTTATRCQRRLPSRSAMDLDTRIRKKRMQPTNKLFYFLVHFNFYSLTYELPL